MATLDSGLPDLVGDEEDLARFLTSSSQYNATMAKPSAFLPNQKFKNTSVFRHGKEPLDELKRIGAEHLRGERPIQAVAFVTARHVRSAQLDVLAKEPPPRHANIEGWPWLAADPELQSARPP